MPERLMQPTRVSWKVIRAWTSEWQIHCEMTGGSQQDANTGLKADHLSAIVDEISRTPVLSNCRTCWMPIWELEWEGRIRLIEVTLLLRCFIQIECDCGGSSAHIVISDSIFIDASSSSKKRTVSAYRPAFGPVVRMVGNFTYIISCLKNGE